jgi:CubicO group peptidase (beta-lactamase class C family)
MVNSTLDDLYRWDRALAKGELLDTAVVFTAGMTNDGEAVGYAFGWATGNHPKHGRVINHSGGWPGYVTFIYRFPDSDHTMIFLRNDGGGKGIELPIQQSAIKVLFGEDFELELPEPIVEVAISVEELAVFEGVFAVMPEFKLRFFEKEGKLITQATDQPELDLAYLGEDRFKLLVVEAEVQFHRDEAGKVTSLTLFQGGQEVPAQRE